MARNRKQRRQQHGAAWHWKQTNCWYCTEPGTKKRVPLFDEKGERIRGKQNKEAARVALARIKLADELNTPAPPPADEWTVAKVCDVYLADLHRSANPKWATQVEKWLNDLCSYCGALKVSEFKKKHLRTWLGRHTTWNPTSDLVAPATSRIAAADASNRHRYPALGWARSIDRSSPGTVNVIKK